MNFDSTIFQLNSTAEFESKAIRLFQQQVKEVAVYEDYVHHLGINPQQVNQIAQIPFLPISFFKTHQVLAKNNAAQLVFESSGTTGMQTSRHLIPDLAAYQATLLEGFKLRYGNPRDWCFLALLPSYLERSNSSLVYMMKHLMECSGHPNNGFYLNNTDQLQQVLAANEQQQQATWLIGVTFALLDFADQYAMPLQHTTVIETGGMKGRKKELTREAVHQRLKAAFQLDEIHGEYGMTELLSQAYAPKAGRFITPPWMKMLIRDMYDPFELLPNLQSGCINCIDLANQHSCAFIATDDIGKVFEDGSFEVSGRSDNSDIRGCSLLTA